MYQDELKKLYAITTQSGFNVTNSVDSWSAHNIVASSLPTTSYAISGQMLIASAEYSEYEMRHFTDDAIKYRLSQLIADQLYASKYIEFTKQIDQNSGMTYIRARVFVTPNSDVQILRKVGY